jgi:Uma2 family endonuclease
MSAAAQSVAPLVPGDKLSREEFLRRWEAMPQVKLAELIGGIVYMPSPLSMDHSASDSRADTWLGTYAAFTPGCETGTNATWLMADDAPQPDVHLWILPEYGGQGRRQGKYARGAPELATEVCWSSTAYDLHQKKELYRSAGVQEYVAVLLREREVRWHCLINGDYELLPPPPRGILRSVIFPGLWLQVKAFLEGDMRRVLEVLHQGLQSPEHAAFVIELEKKRRRTPNSRNASKRRRQN